WALALGFLALLARRWRRRAALEWGDAVLVAAALVMLVLGARAIRTSCVFLLVAVPAASRLLGAQVRLGRARPETPDHPRLNLALLVGISALEAAGILYAWRLPYPELGWRPIAAGALAAVRGCPERVFGRYNDGGPLIWFAPERRVFSDTRQDPYPLAITRTTASIEHGGPYRETFARYGIRCAILPAGNAAAARLAADRWQPRFRDDAWTVLVAPDAAPGR
ncbi:MAG TPA: hypothetical protein VHO06_10525, partial [Polyangia bacterium]|nr:hypothetical protein [Polyangia bacterium]